MSDQQRQQQRQQQQQRQREESRRAPSQPRTTGEITTEALDGAKQKQSDVALADAKVTEGKDGARNLRVQWIDVQLPNAQSCRFAITTTAGNGIEAVMEQKSYRRAYQGTSSLQTDIVSVAPIGTKGKLTVHDLTTGETFEQPWTWHTGARGFWELLLRWFT
jgi:predicted ribosome quality control (RQC) complex YloA/Tae2 family protein